MRSQSDWRSPAGAQDYADYDWGDWAQEFVRRSPQYAREYQAVQATIAAGEGHERQEMEVLARRWGMIFPV
ncbi:MAG: DUF6499 domain-containing protein [Pseudomonadota bacterium]|jgi:Family of unknown function (DUF6499)